FRMNFISFSVRQALRITGQVNPSSSQKPFLIGMACMHTSNVMEGWNRGEGRTRWKFHPTTLRRRKLDHGRTYWTKTKWGKRLQQEMKDRNLMESDPWVQNQLNLKYFDHKPKWRRI
ncbi:hypothetical protein ACHWQZ_G011066, partial [Mnemiopsis leidyi]